MDQRGDEQALGALETEIDMAKRKAMFKRMLEICEREDPAYTVLHQNATFTAKRKDIQWKAAPAFAMDFRADNFRMAEVGRSLRSWANR